MEPKTKVAGTGPDVVDMVIVGAGFAGLYMLHRARGDGLTARLYEGGQGVGGTWYWNRYPGAACDIESLEYSYSFSEELQQEWKWSHRFAPQPEILAYMNHVADRFDLRRDIQFETRVTSAAFDEAQQNWLVTTDHGDRVKARYCVMATGCLSAPKPVEYPGLDSFKGKRYHTAYWPHEPVDFSGERVGVIGTGSSAIQSIPLISEQAAHLHIFQRTPNFSIPVRNGPMDPDHERAIKANYAELRRKERDSDLGIVAMLDPLTTAAMEVTPEERLREYELRWQTGGLYFYTAFVDLLVSKEANDTVAEFARAKIREKVRDPAVAELLCPKDHPFGTKRLCADTNYFETYNRENVTLVDVRSSPIREFTPAGLRTAAQEYELDSIVFATGFDAMTGALGNIDIRGRDAATLKDKWAAGPRTYLGMMCAGFPNLFITTGPGSPSVLFNMVSGNEYHVDWIADAIKYAGQQDRPCIEPTVEAEDAWVEHVNAVGNSTLFPAANSWYMGVNVPGKPQVILPYLGGFRAYSKKCNEVAANGYTGLTFRSH
jgi:cation diffusion facilitator CzcD-associated flavoprotein CzcO